MHYRSDIDGLRALAVLLVLIFHADQHLLRGGYVGVDVFLVISGFVITKVLDPNSTTRGLVISEFYWRRVLRLVPALAIVLSVTLLLTAFITGPTETVLTAKSAITTIVGISNVYFWGQQGYFADYLPEQPLLHTWSLGLEVQFYVVFPLLLVLARNHWRNNFLPAIASMAALSFACNLVLVSAHPGAAFYLLPARAWEYLIGACVALAPTANFVSKVPAMLGAVIGLLSVLTAAYLFSATTQFPGLSAVLPCGGSALLVWACSDQRHAVAKFLSSRIPTAIGRISYSLYLWHWPVLTLARRLVNRDLTGIELTTCIAIAGAISILSLRYVETLFRATSPAMSGRARRLSALAAAFVVVGLAVLVIASDGFSNLRSRNVIAFESAGTSTKTPVVGCHHGAPEPVTPELVCRISGASEGQSRILLWGDSHANAIAPAIQILAAHYGVSAWQASYSSCPPLIGVAVAHSVNRQLCPEFNAMVLQQVRTLGIDRVVLSAFWTSYLPERADSCVARELDIGHGAEELRGGNYEVNRRVFEASLSRTVRLLRSFGVEVWIVEQVPTQRGHVPTSLSRATIMGAITATYGVPLSVHRQYQEKIVGVFDGFTATIRRIDPATTLCRSGTCVASIGNEALYIDANHLSAPGAMQLVNALSPAFHQP